MKSFYLLVVFLVSSHFVSAQVSIQIVSLANNTPEDASIYFAGSLNNWNPGDTNYVFQEREDGNLWLDLPSGNGQVEYKFTRGSWESVESNGSGGYRPNRTFTYGNGDTLELEILGWEDLDQGGGSNSTANEQVMVWKEDMLIPNLDRKRRIWVYLPLDYDVGDKRYPVLYMHDGQNVFDESTSFIGEWKVDESLVALEEDGYPGLIVVAIDNGGVHRIDEYSPFLNQQYGGGEGALYLDFIVHTLKPLVDETFRTLAGPESTGMMGSSMGGLFSHYAHFAYPEVFAKVGIFSPSYWFSDEFTSYTLEKGKTQNARLYLLAGEKESSIAQGTRKMEELLLGMGYGNDELRTKIVGNGEHSEWFWASEFKEAVQWLFPSGIIDPSDPEAPFLLYPNPAGDSIKIKGQGKLQIILYLSDGKRLGSYEILDSGTIELPANLETNQLIVVIESSEGRYVRQLLLF